ncbi:16S rRNA (guanine(527)-N(7))-methyltransferase RsmG [Metallumcola ferriviriculae]|uniref:Ribosomal RNA small subunit methyltransferase G n=1 Tax=Metallumcola ferriviriculae TaxID=3039180 RepID=A0AAU0UJJ7_9FIRM|nr:16S rRNA (guanine(527)-N(7))-methyltransferase RsmG [Desulfitibacteraceae bacterium MK1]
MNKAINIFKQCLDNRNICLGMDQERQIEMFLDLLKQWNKKMNLTAIEDPQDSAIKHLYDSLTVALDSGIRIDRTIKLIDIGSGAGFPGIPLKIFCEQWNVTLVDSLKKRVGFLKTVIDQLDLSGTSVIWGRAEELGQDDNLREQFDVVTARAVAPINVLAEYCLPLAAVGGNCIFMKGPGAQEEVTLAGSAIETLGGGEVRIEKVVLPQILHQRCLVIIKKVKSTPRGYPRRPGIPSKRPL